MPQTNIDLSTYVRVGRYDLPEPTRTVAPANSVLAQEVSAVTYNADTDTLFVVGDGGTSIVQISKTGELIDSMTLAAGSSPQGTEFYDPEGLTYVGGGKFVMTEERDRQLVSFTYTPNTVLARADAQTVDLGTFSPNLGLEGLSYDPQTGGFIIVKEKSPLGVFQTDVDFDAGTATNGSSTTENSVNLFDPALTGLIDIADVFALSNLSFLSGQTDSSHLLILSQETGTIINIDRSGTIHSTLNIQSDAGNPLSVGSQQHEGLTMDNDGYLYVVSENGGGDFDHPQLWVYAPSATPNQAPTALTLNNPTAAILENTSTAVRVKVADVAITDDGLGTNNLTLTGADASFFEVDNTGLYIKAGTSLDFETKNSYSVTVNVDDASVGSTPDASANFTFSVTDIINENPAKPVLYISEVAAWSSGNSPVGVDWFEVTNSSSSAIDITGWKIDDGSNSFASAATLNGITSIAAGESVIFLETADLAGKSALFLSTWFGENVPAGIKIGSYTGSGLGLSTGGDAVNLFNSSGVLQANVAFGASPTGPYATFNNAAGLNNATITTLSVVGVNGANTAVNDTAEIGSPGTVGKLFISEVAPWSSSSANSPVGADWFEVTNTTSSAIDITGWKMDDASGSFAASVALSGITSIAAGESVIFIETANLTAATEAFLQTWFGANRPAGLQIGSYTGSGIGLSTSGDEVNLYNASGLLQARVVFGASSTGPSFSTFDNTGALNNTSISNLSATGSNGAFNAVNDSKEIGSPGAITAVNYPASVTVSQVTTALAENADTTSAIKVADIVVSDINNLGTNVLSLSGADAGLFEIVGNALFLKAGTVLDFETLTSLNVSVNVDDATIGTSPDSSKSVTVAITNVVGISPAASNAAVQTGTNEEDTLIGLNGANTLNGLDANDTLTGGKGNDTLNGGAGNDTFIYTVNDGADAIDGGNGVNTLTILGNAGNDVLKASFNGTEITGIAGGTVVNVESITADLLGGVDTLNYAGTSADVVIDLSNNSASGFTSITGIENGTGGNGNDTLIGNSLVNKFVGGLGNDTYVVSNSDIIIEAAGAGNDQVLTDSNSFLLANSVEKMTFTGIGDFVGTGNNISNIINSGSGNDTINALSGMDIINGGAGNDVMDGGFGNDTFLFNLGFGNDTILGFDADAIGGQDILDISSLGINAGNFASSVTITDLGNDTSVTIGADTIQLIGVNGVGTNAITQQDFLLA